VGTQLTTAHMGTLISAAAPAFVIIFAYWLLKEKLTLIKTISVLVALLGILVIIGFDLEGGLFGTVGKLLVLIGAFGWALYNVYVKRASIKYSPLVISTYSTLAALLITTPFMIWQLDSRVSLLWKNSSLWMGILYLGIMSTAVAFFLWNKGMKHMDAGIGSMFYFFTPLVGSLCGWIFLQEHLSLNFFLGGILIIIGASLACLNARSSETIKKKPCLLNNHN
jgi:drug/metabolite transporter (DMT)-like permease